MKQITLSQAKKLYDAYTPLKSTTMLKKDFTLITDLDINSKSDIRSLYSTQIKKQYLNESIIKAAFIEKFGFSKSPNNTITIFELNTGNSRADLCSINGHSIVYEIKTAYDTFYRLDKQLNDYKAVFDYINVILPEEKLHECLSFLDESIGILLYTQNRLGNINFSAFRQPKLNEDIDAQKQLMQLTKKQLKSLVTNSFIKTKGDIINHLLQNNSSQEINRLYKSIMKDKYRSKWEYLFQHKDAIYLLDYQWFFKNNLPISTVYK